MASVRCSSLTKAGGTDCIVTESVFTTNICDLKSPNICDPCYDCMREPRSYCRLECNYKDHKVCHVTGNANPDEQWDTTCR